MSLFRVFLWKNYKYIRFHWLRTIIILAGCLILFFIVMKTSYAENKQSSYVHEPINEEYFNGHLSSEPDDIICYAPYHDWLHSFMESVRRDLNILPSRWNFTQTKEEMSLLMEEKKMTNSFFIYFDNFPQSEFWSQSDNLSYSISATHGRVSAKQLYYNDYAVVGMQIFDDYTASGFLALQNAIDRKYTERRTGKESYPVEIAPFPRIELWDVDSFRVVLCGLLFMLFLYIIMLTTFIVPLVEEKHDGMQAYLSFATGQSYLNRVTFYLIKLIIYFVFFTKLSLLIAYCYNGIGNICYFYSAMLYTFFMIATMNYALLISVFLKSVYFAKIGGFLAFFVPTILFSIEGSIFQRLAYLMSGNVFMKGLETIQIFTIKRREITFSDIFLRITDSSLTLFEVYSILIVQMCVYIALYNYLANIFPGIGGVRKPYYYPLKKILKSSQTMDSDTSSTSLKPEMPIQIIKLVKTYKGFRSEKKVAVNNLNMEIGKNKITVLLGHNGAGKTTTINMIIGSIEKTAGSIIVLGKTTIEDYRNYIGYCPQHNIFMQYMTCMEHLYFFSMLRGKTSAEAEEEAYTLLSELLLKEKANEVGEKLSGGMKRRLALGMAVAGNTSIAILDEPTSGLDPESRRTLWDILIKLRKTRSILITTHYMEEAEILGDEIAIMSHGTLVCSGNTMDLKQKYGAGYILKLLTNERFDENKTMELIQSHIPKAMIHSFVEPTVCVKLPYENRRDYSVLLSKLENSKAALGISFISVANSSLEDVFLMCIGDSDINNSQTDSHIAYSPLKSDIHRVNSPDLLLRQMLGVVFKKLIYLKRKWIYSLIMCSFPFLTIGITFWIMNSDTTSLSTENPIKLNINIPNSEIYLKIAPGFSEFERFLKSEITSLDAVPVQIQPHESLEETLLNIQEKNITHFYDRIFGAIELKVVENNKPIIKILYSSNLIHSSVSLLNLVDNVFLKFNSNLNISIETKNAPVPRSIIVSPARLEYFSSIVPIGCFFYMLFFVSLPFREKRTQFNKLQNISRTVYWTSFTMFDIILHIIISITIYVAISMFDTKGIYSFFGEQGKFAIVIALYGIAYLPLLYILANSFRCISTLSTYLFLFLIISTIVPIITSTNAKAIETYGLLIYIFMLLPDFALKHQLMVINENYFIRRRNKLKAGFVSPNGPDETLSEDAFYVYMTFLFIVLEIFLIFIWDNIYYRQRIFQACSLKGFCKIKSPTKLLSGGSSKIGDGLETVDASGSYNITSKTSLNVVNLHKCYSGGDVHAVKGIDFCVADGECFGLLGLNGAGKSSTFEMITGNETISAGSVSIKGVDINTRKNRFNSLYGYCPQVDALNGFMTSYEILAYLALLRGTPYKEIQSTVDYWLKQLDLFKYRNVPIKYYSGGTKRKLNTAMAMIGDPVVVFLDEPTTGVDPKSRRFMWECIRDFKRRNKTIVLTSHSMDECENLCNRLAIMANGEIQCNAPIPRLKEEYGKKFTITIRLKKHCNKNDLDVLRSKMRGVFASIEREHHDSTIVYLADAKPWAEVFHKMEALLSENSDIMADYCVSETTLEDIFLKMNECDK